MKKSNNAFHKSRDHPSTHRYDSEASVIGKKIKNFEVLSNRDSVRVSGGIQSPRNERVNQGVKQPNDNAALSCTSSVNQTGFYSKLLDKIKKIQNIKVGQDLKNQDVQSNLERIQFRERNQAQKMKFQHETKQLGVAFKKLFNEVDKCSEYNMKP